MEPTTNGQTTELGTVDLDLLSAPEGFTPNDLGIGMGNAEPAPTPKSPEPIIPTSSAQQKTQIEPTQPVKQEDIPYYLKPFHALKERLGEGYEIPKDVTEENYFDVLADSINQNSEYEFPENTHPVVKQFMEYVKNPEANPEEFIRSYRNYDDILKQDNRELYKTHLTNKFGKTEQNPNGWDEKKIDETITKLDNSGQLDIQAEELKEQIKREMQEIPQRLTEREQAITQARSEEMSKLRETEINNTLKLFDTMKELDGVPIGEADKKEYISTFQTMVTPDEKGVAPIVHLLRSNDALLRFVIREMRGNEVFRNALQEAKEATKARIESKLDPEPRLTKKTTSQPAGVNLDLLAMPDLGL